MSMAEGVEVRVPFLDIELVKLAAEIPDSLKQRGTEGKWILKKAMEDDLPKDVIYRPKTGFGAPLRRWIKNDLKEMAQGIFGHKGRVHIHVCEPLKGQFKDTKDLANSIEKEIIRNYHIWPSSHARVLVLAPTCRSKRTCFRCSLQCCTSETFSSQQ